ncbi:MAG: hypothetical protein QM564_10450 [Bergeyella sp.]
MRTKFYFFALLSLCLFSCRDKDQDPDVLPEATQSGKNTGGALVDGKVWVAKIEQPDLNPGGNNTQYEFVNGEYNLQIVLRLNNDTSSRIVINLSDAIDISQQTYSVTACRYENKSQIFDVSYGNNIGTLTITKFDKQNKIISGSFNFTADNINGNGSKVIITEGRFDKKFL